MSEPLGLDEEGSLPLREVTLLRLHPEALPLLFDADRAYTTLDLDLQNEAAAALERWISEKPDQLVLQRRY